MTQKSLPIGGKVILRWVTQILTKHRGEGPELVKTERGCTSLAQIQNQIVIPVLVYWNVLIHTKIKLFILCNTTYNKYMYIEIFNFLFFWWGGGMPKCSQAPEGRACAKIWPNTGFNLSEAPNYSPSPLSEMISEWSVMYGGHFYLTTNRKWQKISRK